MYDKEFYNEQKDGSIKSAEIIIPYLLESLKEFSIKKVVDFGCGVGGWLSVINENMGGEAVKILGLDGGNAEEDQFYIPLKNFRKMDLSSKIELNEKFDLCMSLEVAEHIDEQCADVFVDNLCRHSDIILFSAAISGQEGDWHLNEQPLSYWAKKFLNRGYECYDFIRPQFWDDTRIQWWYRQNIVLFVHKQMKIPGKEQYIKTGAFDLVHPELFRRYVCRINNLDNHFINWTYVEKKFPHIFELGKRFVMTFERREV